MTVKNIIKTTAILLNKSNVVNYLNNKKTEGDCVEETQKLIKLLETVISELSLKNFFVLRTDEAFVNNQKIEYLSLTYSPIKIVKITDSKNNEIPFEEKAEYVWVKKGKADKVTYAYIPKNLNESSVLDFSDRNVRESMLAYGVAAEYCLTVFDFDAAVEFHKRFIDAVKKTYKITNSEIKRRSWA